jgi:hypothetical protein
MIQPPDYGEWWIIRQKSGWRRFRETVEQVAWTRREAVQTLHAVDFRRIRAYDADAFFRGDPSICSRCRTFYVAQRLGALRAS